MVVLVDGNSNEACAYFMSSWWKVRWMKCHCCRFVSSTFSEAKPPKPIQKLIIESYVFGLLLCCLTPEWTPSITQSILTVFFLSFGHANSPDVQPSCLFCFLFPTLMLVGIFSRISHVFTVYQLHGQKQLVDHWAPRGCSYQLLGGGFNFFCFFLSRKLGKWSNLTNIFQMGSNKQLD